MLAARTRIVLFSGPEYVALYVARDDGMAEVSVIDTGTGLALEVSAQLFRPFVTPKKQGMGVGLSICRTIVESHGGHIWAEAMLPF